MTAPQCTGASAKLLQFARLSGQKRHEAHPDQILLLNSLFTLRELHQLLRTGVRSERQYHRATVGKLADKRVGNGFGGGGDDDAVVGRALRDAGGTISDLDLDV